MSVLESVDDITHLTEPAETRLDSRQQVAYGNHRRDHAEWLVEGVHNMTGTVRRPHSKILVLEDFPAVAADEESEEVALTEGEGSGNRTADSRNHGTEPVP